MAKILIVDDAAFMRMMLKDIVVKAGHEVAAKAYDGNEALEKYKELRPDLVTMDITMPNCDGLEAVSNIIASFPDAKIIMVSAMGQQGMVLDAIKRGAKDFIVKPFQAEKVANSIANVLKKRFIYDMKIDKDDLIKIIFEIVSFSFLFVWAIGLNYLAYVK